MLGESIAVATLPVSDLDASKNYYEKTLGLVAVDENPGGVSYKTGSSRIFVYQTDNAGTNKGTAVTWEVNDFDAAVEELKGKGVTFEHYDDMEGVTREGDVHVMGTLKAVWFKDPSGNILNVTSTMS